MTDFVEIHVQGTERVQKKLKALPVLIQNGVTVAVANYLLKVITTDEIPPWKHVSRARAYGRTFQTKRQRRWFFWFFRDEIANNIPFPWHKRRGKAGGIASTWNFKKPENGEIVLYNSNPDAIWLYDDDRQARQLALVGWSKISMIIRNRHKQIDGVMSRATKTAIKKAGLS